MRLRSKIKCEKETFWNQKNSATKRQLSAIKDFFRQSLGPGTISSLDTRSYDKYLSFISTNDIIKKKILTAIRVSLIFLTNALFRILSLVVMVVFFRYISVAIIIGSIGILIVILVPLDCGCCGYKIYDNNEMFELWFLNWLTITNLENTATDRFYRTLGFYYNLVTNMIMLFTIYILSMTTETIETPWAGEWSHLDIVQNQEYLHITLCLTIGCGLTSLVLDLGCKCLGWRSVFNKGWQDMGKVLKKKR